MGLQYPKGSALLVEENSNIWPNLLWEDLTIEVEASYNNMIKNGEDKRKVLLNGLTGFAEPNRIMALMGPSGSGKSTLLDALAGRLSRNFAMCGTVLLNGKERSCNDVSYVTQEDVFLGTLTVRETLTYSAHLRLPSNMTRNEISEVVENAITKMGLQDCAETKIGNWHLRGISNGEKRRLSTCIEILAQPQVLFLDEPTSGLDSASAYFVIWALRNIAYDGRIVICSIHQPSFDVFNLFDDVVLLSGGDMVYFGEAKMAIKFFDDAGFPCPIRKNPPDHFLRCITSDYDKAFATPIQSQKKIESSVVMYMKTEEIKETLVQKYKSSKFLIDTRKRIQHIKLIKMNFPEKSTNELNKERSTSWLKQLCILIRRSSLNMSRDIGYYWLRLGFYILVSISAGTFYFDIGTSNQAILSRGKCDGFVYGLMICLVLGGTPFFIEEIKVFNRERLWQHYGEATFALSNFVSSIPFMVAIALSSGTILYKMVNFHHGVSHYCYFCLNLLCCIAVTEGSTLVVAVMVPNVLMAIGASAGVIVFMMMASNIFRRLSDLPNFFWRYPISYLSYAAWAIEGQYKNDLIGLEFESPVQGAPKLKGEVILREMFGIRPDISKWWDLIALVCLLIFQRLMFYIVLKYKEKASVFLHKLHTNKIVQRQVTNKQKGKLSPMRVLNPPIQ